MPRKIKSPPSFQQDEHYLHPKPHPNPHLYHRLPHPVKHETTTTTTTATTTIMTPSSLKVNRDSHLIKKPSSGTLNSSPTAGSNSTTKSNQPQPQPQPQQQRGPVIIYTHSPKVIHTNPRDFMALVQKLTGMSRNDEAGATLEQPESSSSVPNNNVEEGSRCIDVPNNNNNNNNSNSTDDNESSSVTTDENCSSSSGNNTTGGDVVGQFNPYMMSPQLFGLLPPPPSLPLPSPPSSNLPPLYMPSSSDMVYCTDPTIYDYVDVNFPYDQIA